MCVQLPYALEALPLLRAAAGDPDPSVRAEAMSAFERLSPLHSKQQQQQPLLPRLQPQPPRFLDEGAVLDIAGGGGGGVGAQDDGRAVGSNDLGAALVQFHMEAAVVDASRP